MTESFGTSLNEMDSMLAAIQSAFDRNDLTLAGSLNIALDARLHALSEVLQATAAAGAQEDIEAITARLSAILDRHQHFGETLAGLRDGIGDELARLRRGRLGAAEFLQAAEA